ncbi:MAG: hypothetical protein J6Y04_01170 [Bacteroidaceae bacterium]|nr:hypothetical protein [Bacteroidaceae bacterium]
MDCIKDSLEKKGLQKEELLLFNPKAPQIYFNPVTGEFEQIAKELTHEGVVVTELTMN